MPGLRLDAFNFNVGAYNPANSGHAAATMLNPKFDAAYAATANSEFYLDFGESYHSNDARSFIGADDPQTNRPYDPSGQPVYRNSPLVRAAGEEPGYRYASPHIHRDGLALPTAPVQRTDLRRRPRDDVDRRPDPAQGNRTVELLDAAAVADARRRPRDRDRALPDRSVTSGHGRPGVAEHGDRRRRDRRRTALRREPAAALLRTARARHAGRRLLDARRCC